jgi:type VI secretion system protein VasD
MLRAQISKARSVGAGIALLALAIASAEADPAATSLELTIVGGPELNPNVQGRPSPVVVRIFQLGAEGAFQSADVGALFEHPEEALRDDLIAQAEFVLRPGDIQEQKLDLTPRVRALGIAAAFRELGQTVWHMTVPLKMGRRNLLLIDLDRNTIRLVEQESS